jgi:Flp pilus assembly protein TadG
VIEPPRFHRAVRAGPLNNTHSPSGRPSCGHRFANRDTDAGYSTVEAVLLLPVLVAFTLMVVQFALVWHARAVAESAAQHGVQAARAYTGTDADGRRQARAYLETVDSHLFSGARIDVSRTATSVAVRVRARVLAVAGVPFSVHIDARSTGPLEHFVAPEPNP